MRTRWRERYARRTERMASSIIREILKFAQLPDIISLAGGWPDQELFPAEELKEVSHYILTSIPKDALQYGLTEGYPPLRGFLVEKMAAYGIKASEEEIVVTCGSQQALDLIGRVFIDPGDVILLEKPSYLGAIQAWRAYGADFTTVPLDDEGMCVEFLEEIIIESKPKLIYALPNFHNPAGVTLSLERREKLVELANRYGVPIIEDDPYGELRYEGEHIPPLFVLDEELEGGNVIYLSTFSKTLAPGLRVGWVVAPKEVARQLVLAKQGADLHTSTFSQVVAYEYCRRGLLRPHVLEIRATYKERRDAMLAALEDYFPEEVRWTHPQGGLFLWVILPEGMDSVELLREAVEEEKVAFVPGTAFYADGTGLNTMRLTFASADPSTIDEGIRRLGRVIKRRLLTKVVQPCLVEARR